ncbi:trehalose-phosphatase [Candidatus Nomurabacteria bacterium]|nr:trehalose-phosphatase [Candidatus Nomurabacteria bacterium]
MKYLFDNLPEIKAQIEKAGGAALLFDFDGVLSAIAPTPEDAIITDEYAGLLKKCAAKMPVAIITGRRMYDIKKKIDTKSVLYLAGHGLEWEEDGKDHVKEIPKETMEAIRLAEEKVKPLLERYPGMILENKSFTIAVHYRLMKPELAPVFIEEVESILRPFAKDHKLRLDHSIKTFELRPEVGWDKGDSVLFATEHFQERTGKNSAPIYIGDSQTDEDAFAALEKSGITIRINSSENENIKSAAKWYMKNQKEVGQFMKWLLAF